MPRDKRVDVFDFDGTLVSVNSFHLFVIYLVCVKVLYLDIGSSGRLAYLILKRLRGRISHIELKSKVNCLGLTLSESAIKVFVKLVRLFRRSAVAEALLRSFRSADSFAVIASAAPFAYMRHIQSEFAADLIVSFGNPENDTSEFEDNVGKNKVRNIFCLLNVPVSRLGSVYTDHVDDLPLVLIAERVFIVNPSDQFVEILLRHSVGFTLVG